MRILKLVNMRCKKTCLKPGKNNRLYLQRGNCEVYVFRVVLWQLLFTTLKYLRHFVTKLTFSNKEVCLLYNKF